jgi:hypothetical protein
MASLTSPPDLRPDPDWCPILKVSIVGLMLLEPYLPLKQTFTFATLLLLQLGYCLVNKYSHIAYMNVHLTVCVYFTFDDSNKIFISLFTKSTLRTREHQLKKNQ